MGVIMNRYPGTHGKVASRAIPGLLATATRKGVFQDQDIYLKWGQNEYIWAWKKYYPHIWYKPPPLDLLRTDIWALE
ncbi:hypothetical protein FRC06_001471 [Ceratobasidium sp. 370]|nr:hypothetical protein FRC06_001471 [Ceratobasidium sp. 370]